MKCFVISVVTGATGKVTEGLKIPGNNIRKAFNKFSTKISVLETSLLIRESATL